VPFACKSRQVEFAFFLAITFQTGAVYYEGLRYISCWQGWSIRQSQTANPKAKSISNRWAETQVQIRMLPRRRLSSSTQILTHSLREKSDLIGAVEDQLVIIRRKQEKWIKEMWENNFANQLAKTSQQLREFLLRISRGAIESRSPNQNSTEAFPLRNGSFYILLFLIFCFFHCSVLCCRAQ
jgi:hypothetical protein